MAQQGMAMLTRVGNSGLWQSATNYKAAAKPFYQEQAVAELLRECIFIENSYSSI
jgi:hypothetical protein